MLVFENITVSSHKTMADGGIRVQIDLGIIDPSKLAVLYGEFMNKEGSLLLADPESMENLKGIILESTNYDVENE